MHGERPTLQGVSLLRTFRDVRFDPPPHFLKDLLQGTSMRRRSKQPFQADGAIRESEAEGHRTRTASGDRRTDVLARHPLPLAGLLALVTLPLHLVLPPAWSVTFASTVLALIGGIYIGFALLDGRPGVIVRECLVALVFVVFASVSAILAPLLLPLGYIAHGLWDAAHRPHGLDLAMPRGYVPLCAFYDVLAGLGLWLIWSL